MADTIRIHLLRSNKIHVIKKGSNHVRPFFYASNSNYLCFSESSPAVILKGSMFCLGGIGQVA